MKLTRFSSKQEDYPADILWKKLLASKTISIHTFPFYKKLEEYKIGILHVEEVADGNMKLLLSVEEYLDCSGLPDLDMETCRYDEGFLKGILEFQTGGDYSVKEIDCWCLGGRTCSFEAKKTD